ncbi:MAG: hypothetical protein P4L22_06970 [Candidatus Babeliales bacterium]|nr:hypothetical protein [Candidatus Babeliales bacterium]
MKLRLKDAQNYFAQKSFLIRCSIFFIFLSFIFAIWFFFIFDKFSNKLNQINQEIIILKKNKVLLNKLIKQKSENIIILLDLKKQIENLYPNDLDLNQILRIAHDSGLELINYGLPVEPKDKNTIEKVDNNLVPLSFKGNFHQILEFITKNLENKKLFKFEKINIIKLEDNVLKFDCVFNCTCPLKLGTPL